MSFDHSKYLSSMIHLSDFSISSEWSSLNSSSGAIDLRVKALIVWTSYFLFDSEYQLKFIDFAL